MKTVKHTFFIPAYYWDSAALVLTRFMHETLTPNLENTSKGKASVKAHIETFSDVDNHGVNVTLVFEIKEEMPVEVVVQVLSCALITESNMRIRVERSEEVLSSQYSKFEKKDTAVV
tara:strand:+ start:61 stop:411 length:351 start_codon:yes stop_codon:yes gene_type:complete